MKALDYFRATMKEFKHAPMQYDREIAEIIECIAELEALQHPKQCNTCNFYHSFTGVCANDKCPLCTDFVDADFGCIYHEAKGAMR